MDKELVNYYLDNLYRATGHLLRIIKEDGLPSVMDRTTKHVYHDKWKRINIAKSVIQPIGKKINIDTISAFVLFTNQDTTKHIFYHLNTVGLATILGEQEGCPDPRHCHYFYKSITPIPAASGTTLRITPEENAIYGFSSPKESHIIKVLCVMSSDPANDHRLVTKKP